MALPTSSLGNAIVDLLPSLSRDASLDDPRARAVAQIVNLDTRSSRVIDDGKLIIRCTQLRNRRFLGGFPIAADSPSRDVERIIDHWTFASSTGVLIDRYYVLTAGHAVIQKRLDEMYFIFGRTPGSSIAAPGKDRLLRLPVDSDIVRRAVRVEAISNPKPNANDRVQPDWAIVELDRPIDAFDPCPLHDPRRFDELEVFSHPLGVPMQVSTAAPATFDAGLRLGRLTCDFGSGGSGSPLFDGKYTVGIVSGNVRFHVDQRVGSRLVVSPIANPKISQTQPTTFAAEILAHWPDSSRAH